jgi:hypothetical protein
MFTKGIIAMLATTFSKRFQSVAREHANIADVDIFKRR